MGCIGIKSDVANVSLWALQKKYAGDPPHLLDHAEQNHSLHTGCRKCSLNTGGIGRYNDTRLHDDQNLFAYCHHLDVALGITIDNMACKTSMPCVEHASTLWDECAPALQRRTEEGEKLLGGVGSPYSSGVRDSSWEASRLSAGVPRVSSFLYDQSISHLNFLTHSSTSSQHRTQRIRRRSSPSLAALLTPMKLHDFLPNVHRNGHACGAGHLGPDDQ